MGEQSFYDFELAKRELEEAYLNDQLQSHLEDSSKSLQTTEFSYRAFRGDLDDLDFELDPDYEGMSQEHEKEKLFRGIHKDPLFGLRTKDEKLDYSSFPQLNPFNFKSKSSDNVINNMNKKHKGMSLLSDKNDSPLLSLKNLGVEIETGNTDGPPTHGRFITMTDSKGRVSYIRRKNLAENRFDSSIQKKEIANSQNLLSKSIHHILDDIDRMETKKRQTLNEPQVPKVAKKTTEDLWVDKYRPTSYFDLIGDYGLIREALGWIKQWDNCVFGVPFTPIPGSVLADNPAPEKVINDPLQRPKNKIMLFCGPPGLGKTSLAHVLAKQSGYNVVEINASDDRTASVVKDRIITATQNKSMIGSKKPNLIIVDEIDGVSSVGGADNFINLLIQMAQNTEEEGENKRNKKKIKPLQRPIICICNDQFTPALRNLKQYCEIFQFRKPHTSQLVGYLKEMCKTENVTISQHTLTTLCEITECDMRATINTLQFLSESNDRKITLEMVTEGQAGMLDSPKSIFTILESIFTLPPSRTETNKKRALCDENGIFNTDKKYINSLVSMIDCHGSYNTIMEGCFENYLNSSRVDLLLENVVQMNEIMCLGDEFNARIHTRQQTELLSYAPYMITPFHTYFAGAYCEKMTYPKAERQLREQLHENRNILNSFYHSFAPRIRKSFSFNDISTYVASYAHLITQPDLNRVILTSLKPDEREKIEHLIDFMCQLKLRFAQVKDENGQLEFKLEPPIDKVIFMELKDKPKKQKMRHEVAQFISQELEHARARLTELKHQSKELSLDKLPSNSSQTRKKRMFKVDDKKTDAIPNQTKRKKYDPFKAFKQKRKDANGNIIGEESEEEEAQPVKYWFRFNDGSSNAVRKPALMEDFM